VTISEDLTFSWPIVVMLCVSAAAYAGVVASVRQHHASAELHLTMPALENEFPRRTECLLKHGEVERRLAGIDTKLDQLIARKD
jgi:hypothetical protein